MYIKGELVEKARAKALKMLIIDKIPTNIVADRFGVNRSTIWRWHQKWSIRSSHIELENSSRRKYLGISPYKYELCEWRIESKSSSPKYPHCLSKELVELVLNVRDQIKRCAEVVWHYINVVLCIKVSLLEY